MRQSNGQLYFLKKAIQILLSVSMFSLLFSQSSVVPVIVHFFDSMVSNVSIKFFTFKSERNYIFLLCNGIVVLIIKLSGLINKSPENSNPKHTQKADESSEDDESSEETKEITVVKQAVEDKCWGERDLIPSAAGHRTDVKVPLFIAEVGHDLHEIDKQEEEEKEEELGLLSAEELNKKCEDFIQRIKQEIRMIIPTTNHK